MSRSRYVRVPIALLDNPRVDRLCLQLGAEAFICYVRLLLWAAIRRPFGTVWGSSDTEIEHVARWSGTPGDFAEALRRATLARLNQHGRTVLNIPAGLQAEAKQTASKSQASLKQKPSKRQASAKVGSGTEGVN